MKTIETKVYTFDELSDEAKEKARDWFKEGDDMPFMKESMNEKLMDLLADNGIKYDESRDEVECYYSLAYCQGDGAMFVGQFDWNGRRVKVTQSGHYYHAYSREIDIPDASEREYADFEKLYVGICKKLERYGYDFIESEQSNDVVDENIRANEYTFTAEGKRFG